MLKTMYKTDKVFTIFVLTNEPDKVKFPENTGYIVVDNINLELEDKKPNKVNRPFKKMYIKDIVSIDYYSKFKIFQKKLIYSFFKKEKEETVELFKNQLFFERGFLGYFYRDILDLDIVPNNVNIIYVCLNKNLSITFFFVDENRHVYEIINLDKKPTLEKKRIKFSRSRKMLIYLRKNKMLYKLSNTKLKKIFEFTENKINSDLLVKEI